jgi:AcrR family transcriptional regulator
MTDNIRNQSTMTGGMAPGNDSDKGPEAGKDLTARVRIRDAALKHFAQEGYDRATIRAIARSAGVSHGMLRHHFGSKIDLRSACDDYVFRVLHRLNTLFLDLPRAADASLQSANPLWRYAARSLVDRSPTAAPIFDELVVMTTRRLAPLCDLGSDRSEAQKDALAALVASMVTAIPLFHEQISRALGLDLSSPEGDAALSLALRDIFAEKSHRRAPITTPG